MDEKKVWDLSNARIVVVFLNQLEAYSRALRADAISSDSAQEYLEQKLKLTFSIFEIATDENVKHFKKLLLSWFESVE